MEPTEQIARGTVECFKIGKYTRMGTTKDTHGKGATGGLENTH
jgi:hypothetical protein